MLPRVAATLFRVQQSGLALPLLVRYGPRFADARRHPSSEMSPPYRSLMVTYLREKYLQVCLIAW